ncbi:MAG TPA: methylenetetrahydrofolate reductase [Ilumatobacter sp.]|nr:methylenetetrahydrofolate reductase [Ilumatobacter sp.]
MSSRHPHVSFEFFPPKSDKGLESLQSAIAELSAVMPMYHSITYGAGGSTRDFSFAAIEAASGTARHDAGTVPIAPHLTCVGQSRDDVFATVDRFAALGVTHIVALRGDPPEGIDAAYTAHADGFQSTAELVAAIMTRGDFSVAVSAYPEKHPQSPSFDHDLDVLAAKVDAGAKRAMTQMFFDNDLFLSYRDRASARGIDIPIVPGIFPIHSFPAVARFAAKCGASMPASIAARFHGLDDDPEATFEVAAEVAAQQINDLAAEGIEHVHIYTLNKAPLALAVCERIGLRKAAS